MWFFQASSCTRKKKGGGGVDCKHVFDDALEMEYVNGAVFTCLASDVAFSTLDFLSFWGLCLHFWEYGMVNCISPTHFI